MRYDRVCRKGFPRDVIRQALVKGRGCQFDPHFPDALLTPLDAGAHEKAASA